MFYSQMKKIILHIDDWIDDDLAMEVVSKVIKWWKVSDDWKMYCYATIFTSTLGREIVVWNQKNYNSDTITMKIYFR